MEAKIRRGRLLREILKQERLTPLPEKFQLAWLIAFNDGLFDAIEPDAIAIPLSSLVQVVENSRLTLDSDRADWATAVRDWLQAGEKAPHLSLPGIKDINPHPGAIGAGRASA
jgi:F-type H+-transporting ATPase subunit alpha